MKYRVSIYAVNLAVPGAVARVRLGRVAAAVVSAAKSSGTYATSVLSVKRGGPVAALDFATARTIPAGGATPVVLSSADLEGCNEIEIGSSATESGYVDITIEVEQDEAGPPPVVTWPAMSSVTKVA